MQWRVVHKYRMDSECGDYTISKAYIRDQARYTAWWNGADTRADGMLGTRSDLDEAKAICEQHRRMTGGEAA